MTLLAARRHDRHPGPMYPTADTAFRRSVVREVHEAAASKPRLLDRVQRRRDVDRIPALQRA